jgi:hypothetical protein
MSPSPGGLKPHAVEEIDVGYGSLDIQRPQSVATQLSLALHLVSDTLPCAIYAMQFIQERLIAE